MLALLQVDRSTVSASKLEFGRTRSRRILGSALIQIAAQSRFTDFNYFGGLRSLYLSALWLAPSCR
jgi:hypothetical protein